MLFQRSAVCFNIQYGDALLPVPLQQVQHCVCNVVGEEAFVTLLGFNGDGVAAAGFCRQLCGGAAKNKASVF